MRSRKLLQVSSRAVNTAAAARPGCGSLHDTAARRPQECGTLGSAASLPSFSGRSRVRRRLPRPRSLLILAGLRLGDCGLPKVTPPAPRRARPDSPCAAQTGSPSSAAPRGPLPRHGGAGPGDPSKGARPSRHCRRPPAPQASLPAGPEPPRPRTHRRGDSLPPPAGPGQAHVRARLPRRRYAAMAARAELSGVPPSLLPSLLPGLRSPRGRGLSRPYPCRGAGSGPGGAGKALAVPLSCGSCGARSRWVGPGAQTHTRRGAASELGGLLGRCEGRERRVTSAQHHPAALESAPGEREVTCRALPASVGCCPAGPGSSSWDREICYRGQATKSGLWGLWHSVGHPAFVWDVQLAHCCTVQSGVGRRDASPYKKCPIFCLEKSGLTGDTPSFLLMTVFYVQLVVLLQASFPQGWQVRVDMLV